jgi:uncharacterized membrane protein YtjA (UPF0391 family)
MADDGFDVDVPALRQYANDLIKYETQTKKFGELIVHAKVPGHAWGVVGYFAKDSYQESCGKLREFAASAERFLSTLDENVAAAANIYDTIDEATKKKLDELNKAVEAISRAARVSDAKGVSSTHDPSLILPGPVGGWVKFGTTTLKELKGDPHGTAETVGAVGHVVVEGAEFAWECYHAYSEVMFNPMKALISMGLDFLLEVIGPLNDLLHLVTGDPEKLEHCAEQFEQIGEGLEAMSVDFVDVTDKRLKGWAGDASMAARHRLAEFSDGVDGLAARAASVAEILEMSAIVMEVIEDLVKSIISELVMWLITLWIPALAAGPFTFGGSTAAAAGATVVKTTQTVAETTSWIDKLLHMLHKIEEILIKLAFSLGKAGFKAIAAGGKHHPGKEMDDAAMRKSFEQKQNEPEEFEREAQRERAELPK